MQIRNLSHPYWSDTISQDLKSIGMARDEDEQAVISRED